MERIIYLTGTEPYGKQRRNITKELVLRFGHTSVRGCKIVPVVFAHNIRTIRQKILDIVSSDPDFIVSLGVNENDAKIYFEKIAKNNVDYETEGIVDGMGFRPLTGLIEKDSPEVIENKFDTSRIELDFKTTRVPYKISRDAGTTFNNLIAFHTMNLRKRNFIFLSMPNSPETVLNKGDKALDMKIQEKALSLLLKDVALSLE